MRSNGRSKAEASWNVMKKEISIMIKQLIFLNDMNNNNNN